MTVKKIFISLFLVLVEIEDALLISELDRDHVVPVGLHEGAVVDLPLSYSSFDESALRHQ